MWLVEFCELMFSMLSGRSSMLALPTTYYWECMEAVGVYYYYGFTILAELTLFLKLSYILFPLVLVLFPFTSFFFSCFLSFTKIYIFFIYYYCTMFSKSFMRWLSTSTLPCMLSLDSVSLSYVEDLLFIEDPSTCCLFLKGEPAKLRFLLRSLCCLVVPDDYT